MNNIKVFILAYARQNLGDDLFINMLLKKYPDVSFYINIDSKEHAKQFENYENLTIISEKERDLKPENVKDFDAYIYIGGSIFMEGGVVYNITNEFLEFLKECKKNNIPFHYISSNFGPYYTNEYLELARKVYENITDICFRDKYSYKLFEEISNVRYAPDLAFSYKLDDIEKKENTVGISVIDLQIRQKLIHQEENYINMLVKNILNYIDSGKEVYLFSFCKYEGDENTIKKVMDKLPDNYIKYVHNIKYQGNLEEFLKIYASMEYMVCARFHAMVLSVVFEQKCKIMSYSDKIDNVIQDLSLFKEQVIHFEKLTQDTKMPLNEFEEVLETKRMEISQNAIQQLQKVDESIKLLISCKRE